MSWGQAARTNMILLWGSNADPTATTNYSFGVNSSVLRYNVPAGTSHVFYGGTSEQLRVNSTTVTVQPNLSVVGTSTLGGLATVNDDLRVNGAANVTGTANVSAVHCADYIDVLAGSGQRSRFFGDLRCYGQMAAAYVRESNGTQQPYALTGSLFISSADGWDARASKRTLSAATLYIGVDNTSALVFVHATNKASAGTSKVGFALVSMLKRWSTGANVHVFMKDSINMSTFSITANTSGIDVSTDSDCSVIWRIMGAY